MAAKTLFFVLALAFIAGSQSARPIDETDSKVTIDPCTHIFKPLYCFLPPTPSPPASSDLPPFIPAIDTTPATHDPCKFFFKPLYCYLPHASPATPAAPVVTPSPPATPATPATPAAPVDTPSPPAAPVAPSPPAADVTPSPPAATTTCTPPLDLISNCGTFFFLSRTAHDNCCREVSAMSDSCLASDILFSFVEREVLSLAKRACA